MHSLCIPGKSSSVNNFNWATILIVPWGSIFKAICASSSLQTVTMAVNRVSWFFVLTVSVWIRSTVGQFSDIDVTLLVPSTTDATNTPTDGKYYSFFVSSRAWLEIFWVGNTSTKN